MRFFSIDLMRIHVGAGSLPVFKKQAEVIAHNLFGQLLIRCIAGTQSIIMVKRCSNRTPIVRKSIAKKLVFAKPMPVPMADSYLVQVETGLKTVERLHNGKLPLDLVQISPLLGFQIDLSEQLQGRGHDALFIIHFTGRIVHPVGYEFVTNRFEVIQQ